jgi:DNA-binding FrmR family transcriptional regulator
MTPEHKKKALLNFKKTQSLMGKIIEMLENGEYCVNVMQQNLAAIGLLKSAHQTLMAGHLNSCFKSAVCSKDTKRQQAMVDEILTVNNLLNK